MNGKRWKKMKERKGDEEMSEGGMRGRDMMKQRK